MKLINARYLIFITLATCILIVPTTVFCQEKPISHLITISELVLENALEKTGFSNLNDSTHSMNLLSLMLGTSIGADSARLKNTHAKLLETVGILTQKIATEKKPEKILSIITKEIHSKYFLRYNEYADFNDVVNKGTYSSISGIALYAWLLKELNIAYTFGFSMGQNTLQVNLGKSNFSLGCVKDIYANPIHSKEFIGVFLGNLLDIELVEKQEIYYKSTDEVFKDWYYRSIPQNIRELISQVYLNKAINLIQYGQNKQAAIQLEKAYALWPILINEGLLIRSIRNALNSTPPDKEEYVNLLIKLTRSINWGETPETITQRFELISKNVLIDGGDSSIYQQSYKKLIEGVSDNVLIHLIDREYNFSMGFYHKMHNNPIKSLPYFAQALRLDPSNERIIELTAQTYYEFEINATSFKPYEKSFSEHILKFPDLASIKAMIEVNYHLLLSRSYEELANGAPDEGLKYLQRFETIYNIKEKNYYVESKLSKVYNAYCLWLYKKGKIKQALQIAKKGLDFLPEDYDLKKKKKHLESL